jgi:hypothetical protein
VEVAGVVGLSMGGSALCGKGTAERCCAPRPRSSAGAAPQTPLRRGQAHITSFHAPPAPHRHWRPRVCASAVAHQSPWKQRQPLELGRKQDIATQEHKQSRHRRPKSTEHGHPRPSCIGLRAHHVLQLHLPRPARQTTSSWPSAPLR